MTNAKVLGRTKDLKGEIIGNYNDDPILNTIIYNVELPDGAVKQYSANMIAENMYAQVDSEGNKYDLLEEIIDFKKDGHALRKGDEYVVTKRGQRRLRRTTIGRKLLVRWKGGSEQWIQLKDMKESNPVDVTEFAVSRDL